MHLVSRADGYMADRPTPTNANEYIEQQLDELLKRIEQRFGGHALTFSGPIVSGVDDHIRASIENRYSLDRNGERLIVILTTPGGYVEVAQRIVETFRQFYDVVEFVVPNCAFSAGTIIVMSGDAIHMDYYSRLGPIDPQIENREGRLVPALGYVKRYEQLVKDAREGGISQAEIQLLISGFDQAVLYQLDQSRQLSITLLEEWLPKYKFKNWITTKTRGLPVTEEMRKARAVQIAVELNNTDKWHTHGRGISRDVLEKDLGLVIDDFGLDSATSRMIRDYHNLISDYMGKLGHQCVVHTAQSYKPLG